MLGLTHPGQMSATVRLVLSNYYKLFPNQKIRKYISPEISIEQDERERESERATHTVVAGYLMLYKCPAGSVLSYDDISLMKL